MNDNYILIFFIGLIVLQLLTKIIKSMIKEERPVKSKTYGMPSTKAATLSFIVCYFILTNKLKNKTIIILLIGLLIGVCSKYYMKEHSIPQLLAGVLLGGIYSYFLTNLTVKRI